VSFELRRYFDDFDVEHVELASEIAEDEIGPRHPRAAEPPPALFLELNPALRARSNQRQNPAIPNDESEAVCELLRRSHENPDLKKGMLFMCALNVIREKKEFGLKASNAFGAVDIQRVELTDQISEYLRHRGHGGHFFALSWLSRLVRAAAVSFEGYAGSSPVAAISDARIDTRRAARRPR
jgi:hypothetical protein